jgi:hypothetical protein
MNARRILLIIGSAVLVAGCGSTAIGAQRATYSGALAAPAVAPVAGSSAGLPSGASSSNGSSGSGSSSSNSTVSADSSGGDIVVGSPGADVARSVTAAYTVPTGAFLSSFDTVIADGAALGGYVVSSQTSPNSKGVIVSGEVTLAVPTAQMASLLNSLPSDFTASSINFSSVDDTNDITDLNARLTSAQAHLTALQGLLAKATSLDDITTLEQQIEDVETSIDTDQSQLSIVNEAVADATVTIQLKERGAVVVAAKKATGPSVTSAASKGWTNALVTITVAVEVLVTAVPAVVLLLIGWVIWRFRRRRSPAPRAEAAA